MVRIRKHAAANASKPQVKCELNLSPWDVTPFTLQFEFDYQLKIEDEFLCDTLGKEPVYAPGRSLASLKKLSEEYRFKEEEDLKSLTMLGLVMKKKGKKKVVEKKAVKDDNYVRCVKTDGKTWQCKKEAQQGEELCEHHLVQLKSYHNKYNQSAKKPKLKAKAAEKARVVKASATATATLVANKKRNRGRVQTKPADFYYYSGFGPSWGKKRRGGDESIKGPSGVLDDSTDEDEDRSSSSHMDQDEDDQVVSVSTGKYPSNYDNGRVLYDFEDDEEDEEEGDVGTTRIRKPIKERSLNSLF